MPLKQKQKLPLSKKNSDWKKANVDYYCELASTTQDNLSSLYQMASGELDETEYSYITNPYGTLKGGFKNLKFPYKLKNYPIIPDILNLLFGEKRRRPIVKSVYVKNEDSHNAKKIEEFQLISNNLQQMYINILNEQGVETGVESKETPPLEEELKKFAKNWNDLRASKGDEILDYIYSENRLPIKFLEGFKHWVITSTVFSIKIVDNDEIDYRIVEPKYVGYIDDSTIEYIEEAEAAKVTEYMTTAEFLDRFHASMTKELYEYIDEYGTRGSNGLGNTAVPRAVMDDLDRDWYDDDSQLMGRATNETLVMVEYVNWKSWEQNFTVEYVTPVGEVNTEHFLFKFNKEEFEQQTGTIVLNVTKTWVNHVWEGYRVDGGEHYFDIQPVPYQRGSMNNPSKCKLLINGRVRRIGDIRNKSIVELLAPYQHLYNFGHFKLNNIIAKSKDRLLLMPLGLLPEEEGWDMNTSMYFADATSMLWVDETKDSTKQALNAIKSIDLSLFQYIQQMREYLMSVKQEAEGLVGITPERKGRVSASQGKGVTERATFQSSLISEDMFAEYDDFQRAEMQGFLDLSKFSYRNGKKASYISSDERLKMLDVTAEDIVETDYGVFVADSGEELEKRQLLADYAHAFAQNGMRPSAVADIIATKESYSKLRIKLQQLEVIEQEIQQRNQQFAAEQEQAKIQAEEATKEKDRQLEYYKTDANNITKEKVALIQSRTQLMTNDLNVNDAAVEDSPEIVTDNINEREKMVRETQLKSRELDIKEKEIKSKERIEDKKAEVALKNKVVGEK